MTEAGPARGGRAARTLAGVWKTFTHPVTFVALSLLWCLDLAAGSIMAYRADPNFSARMDAYPFRLWLREVGSRTFPHSLWVYILVVLSYLLVLSLLLCTVNWFLRRRNRLRGLGEVLVHLGFLFLFGGFVMGSTLGTRVQGINLPVGGAAEIAGSGLTLGLEDLRLRRDARGRPRENVSDIVLLREGKEAARGEVRLNHPLIHGSTVVYPRDTAQRLAATELSIAGGPALRLEEGRGLEIEGGKSLRAAAFIQEGERKGSMIGPGVFLILRGPGESHLGSAFFSASGRGRRQAVLDGVSLRLVRFIGEPAGVYDVHRDPGVWLVIVGTVVLAMGTLWSLAGYLGLIPSTAKEEA